MDIPLYQRNQLPPSRAGKAKPNYSIANKSGMRNFGNTVAGFSGDIFNKLIKTQAVNQEAEFQGKVNQAMQDWESYVTANPNASFEDLAKAKQTMMKGIKDAGSKTTNSIARTNITNWYAKNEGVINKRADTTMEAIKSKQELGKYNLSRENLIKNVGNLPLDVRKAELEKLNKGMIESGLLNAEISQLQQAQDFEVMDLAQKKVEINNIKPLLAEAINEQGKDRGYEVLKSSIDTLVKNGTLTRAEAAETDKVLGDWVDNYASGRMKREKDAAKLTTRQTYQQLMPLLLDSESAETRYDMVEQSKLSKDDKELFNSYVKGSYKDSPTINTSEGHKDSCGVVFDAMTLELSPKDAYDELMRLRFTERSITDEQFKWAVDKIENPYPRPVTEALRSSLNNNLHIGWFDDETDKKVNEKLIAFVDDLVGRDKVPDFDLDKKLYAMSQKYRYGINSGFQIGNVVDIDGTDWEVVGFDKTGEPLMEAVE